MTISIEKILVSGCSYTSGHGYENQKKNPRIWPNQLGQQLGSNNISNVSRTASNNEWIFLEVLGELSRNHYDLALVCWSTIPRFSYHVGLELYNVHTRLQQSNDHHVLNNKTVLGKWLDDIGDRLRSIHNDHWDLLSLVKYVNVLTEYQHSQGGQIFFINGIGPWSQDYFEKKIITVPSDLDEYTSSLLDANLRDDNEIFQLYNMIHNDYQHYGGIRSEQWLNLYESLKSLKIDTIAPDEFHPGPQSQDLFAEYLYSKIQSKLK